MNVDDNDVALRSDATVHTVNGRVTLDTTGIGSAVTVNGSIDASSWAEPLEFHLQSLP